MNGCANSATQNITVNPLPLVTFVGLDTLYDVSDPASTLIGGPSGGTFLGPGINSDEFDPALAGVGFHDIFYEYTDVNGCTSSDSASTEVRDYDYREGARIINDIDNWCSVDAAYTTNGATADENKPSCWSDGPAYNRWFMFQATSNEVMITLKTGGDEGTMRRPRLALWDSTGNEIACEQYYSAWDDIDLGAVNLVPGEWYFISVDNDNHSWATGSFTLCIDDEVDYDFKEGAEQVYHFPDWCSDEAAYSTTGASPDRSAGSCWANGPSFNRWFTFQATDSVLSVEVKTGGTEGTARRLQLALWDEFDTELACKRYSNDYDDVKLQYVGLTPGTWYYVSVDNFDNSNYTGSFTICLNNEVDYDFRIGAIELTDIHEWCSADAAYTTYEATPQGKRASTWNSGPNYDRWFKFHATTDQIKAEMKTGGDLGTLRYGYIAIWDSMMNEVSSGRYSSAYDHIITSAINLIPGDLYYITVDNRHYSGYRGTFSLCVTDSIGYDYKEGAIDLDDIDAWCSADKAYTTMDATPDRLKGSAWNTGANYNRWFRFVATNDKVKATLRTGGDQGTLRFGYIAIWDSLDNEISSARYTYDYDNVITSSSDLIPGQAYWISVDNYSNNSYRGSFSLCVDDTLDYDFREAAIELTDLDYWCSGDAEYTTFDASPDEEKGSAWPNGPNYNRWFRFQATKAFVKIDMKTGGDEGTLRHGLIALWDSAGNEITSARYDYDYDDITVSSASLTPGEWYFISVDNHQNAGYRGTFTLCISDTIDYDFKEAALEVPHSTGWCSLDAAYSTMDATPDRIKGSTWNTGPNYNRWFKFKATKPFVKVDMKTGGLEGSLRYPYLAIFNEDDVEIASSRYTYDYDDISVSSDSLSVGSWYYIAADNRSYSGYRGSFSLCIADTIDYDFKAAAIEITDIDSWCSPLKAYTTIDATPDEIKGSMWNSGPNYNRWFKFTATSTMVSARLKTGGDEGSLRNGYIAIWDSAGNEVSSARYTYDYDDVAVSSDTLTPGELYYISVDNHSNSGYRGTFSLCVDDTIDYDWKSAAYIISDYNEWCSDLKQFSTIGASADEQAGSCWNTGPNFNRWFKFQATSTDFTARLLTGGEEGTLRYGYMALFDSSGNELACRRYAGDYDDLEITSDTFDLVIGEWYYLSIDNHENTSHRGTFSLCLDDELSYDFKDGAEILSDLNNWCSSLASFNTINATPDESAGSCWPNGPNYNRWFMFQATTSSISAIIRTYGIEGDIDRIMVSLWDESLNEIDCNTYLLNQSDVEVSSTGLTPGSWYYITVDNYSGNGYRGSFTVCITDNLVNDNLSGAIELSDLNGWCSENSKYTNSIATADESQGSCWTGAENKNVWFKFTPQSGNAKILLKTGGEFGSMTNPQIAVWDSSLNEVSCAAYSGSDTLTINLSSLVSGDLYYISVDDDGTSGTFSLCIDDDVVYTYPSGAYEITDTDNWCSPEAAFSNSSVNPDTVGGSCWTGTENKNAWFKFQATGPEIRIEVKTGSSYGGMRRQQLGLWNQAGDEIGCSSWRSNTGTIILQSDSLTAGNWYYFAVDDDKTSGSFTLCLDDSVDYDFRQNAYDISDLTQWCSDDEQFTNYYATGDGNPGSCWSGSADKNVWFKFIADTPYAKITLKTGNVYGNMQRQEIALFNSDNVEVACGRWTSTQGSVIIQTDSLEVGNTYWISVDDDRVSSTFSICTDDSPDYDYKAGAYELTNITNWCSENEQFSNYWATEDESMASCWSGTENKNVWFKFQASTRFIDITLRTGDVYGDIRRPQMALWRDDGTEVACIGPVIDRGSLILSADTLTPGHWYYLSVDDNHRSNDFTLCIDDQPTYDYKEGAIELAHNAGCSPEMAYTNYFATADQDMGSCWSGTENKNVWFKFQAQTQYLTLLLKTGNVYGDIRRPQMAVWRDDGTEVACIGPVINQGTLVLSIDTLTSGDWYYISVDDNYLSNTFTLCIYDELNYDFWEGAEILAHDAGCSSNEAYTNRYATDDVGMATCWSGTENKNVWFKFQATTPYVTAKLKTGNIYGDLRRPQLALYNEDQVEVKCIGPVIDQGTISLSLDTLTVGNWYWLAVDDNYRSNDFTLCLDNQLDFDYKAGAIEIPHTDWCSSNAVYNNRSATPDESMASCWGGTENKNVWFKFQATGQFATLSLKTGNVYGNMRRGQMALWNEDGVEVKCVGDIRDYGTTTMSVDSLTVGNWYYVSVDDDRNYGSFSLCIDDDVNFDYKQGAIEVQHDYGCYPDASYSNFDATDDQNMGSCWSGTENKNVWFKFEAISNEVKVSLKTGSVYGSMDKQQVALWNENGDQVACAKWQSNEGTVIMQTDSLIAGNSYYISVDDDRYPGSFTLCLDDEVDYDFKSGAIELININDWCSGDAVYDNNFATPDRSQGSCWTGTENKNVWFKFTAITENVIVRVKTGTVYGSMRKQQLALWNENGDEIACATWSSNTGTVTLSADTLTAGNVYYISVDDDRYDGSFSLCVQGNPLDADISGTNVSCYGADNGSVSVTPQGGTGIGYSYSWTLDGTPIPVTIPNPSGLSPGTYEATVTDDGDGSTATVSYVVTEEPPLSLSLSSTNETCPGASDGEITANAGGGTSTAYFYEWYRNGNPTGNVTSSITGLNPGWYMVVVTDAGAESCTITDSVEITTNNTASTDPTGITITNNNICQGTPKTLTVEGGNLGTSAAWKWYLDSGFTSSAGPDGSSLIVDPADTTEYWVRAEGICNNTNAVSGIVYTGVPSIPPTAASSDRNNICPGDGNINLSYTGGTPGDGATAEWYDDAALTNNIGSGNNLGLSAPLITTTYYVRFEGDCNITTAESITINVNPEPSGTLSSDDADNIICEGDTITFTATDGANYEFSVNGNPVQNGSDGTYLTSSLSNGDAVGVNVSNAAGCEVSYSPITISVNELPSVDFATIPDVCEDAAAFDLSQGSPAGGTYSSIGITTSPEFDPSVPGAGTHTITYTYTDANGCTNSATQTITVNALPAVSFAAIGDVCIDAADFTLTEGSPAGGTYSGTGVSGEVFSPSTAGAGTHTITYTYTDGNGCTNSANQTITVNGLPVPAISGPTESCLNGSGIFITPDNPDHSYLWNITGGTPSTSLDSNQVSVDFGIAGTASIEVTETNDITGCTATSAGHNVIVYDKPSIGEIESNNKLIRR